MEPARMGADDLGDRRGEGNHIMPHLSFDFLDAFQIKVRPLANSVSRVLGHQARFRQSLGSCDFNSQPGTKAVLFTPDPAHVRARVTWNHLRLLTPCYPGKLRILNAGHCFRPVVVTARGDPRRTTLCARTR